MPSHKDGAESRRIRVGGTNTPPRRTEARLLPTLIDRLRDDAPHRLSEAPQEYAVTRAQMRDILQRDLAFLLNTTSIEDQIDRERYPQAAASTINFGLPPLAGVHPSSYEWVEIELAIRRAISEFEPRLIPNTLQVAPLTRTDAGGRYNVLLFEVRGMIYMDPYPLEFLVQSSLDLEASRMTAAGTRAT